MNRKISLSVEDMYIKYTGEAFGATGSHNAVTLRMTFGPAWEGTAKTAYFTDALGSASASIVLGLDKLVGGAYEVDVPSEALKYAGEATVTIKGVLTSGDTTTKAITTAAGHFRVLDSELPESAGNVGTITPSDKEQLQAEIDGLENLFTTAKAATEAAAANAKVSETNAKASETAAASSASSAEASKTAAADSAVTAAGSVAAAAQSATEAAGAARSASAAVVAASGSASDAQTSATAASGSASQAQASAAAAAQSAESASASAQTAQSAASSAGTAAITASRAANRADYVANEASSMANTATNAAIAARSWAVGGTGTREGENTNNAKYWAQQAEATVGGDFATKTEAQGYVADHNQSADAHADIRKALNGKEASGTAAAAVTAHNKDTSAHSDIREAVSEAGKAFVITGTLAMDGLDGYTVSGVTVTEAEIQAAIAAGKAVAAKLTYGEDIYELPLVYHHQSQYQFGGNVGLLVMFFSISYTESGIESMFSRFFSASNDSVADLSENFNNQNQTLTTHINDTGIHVTAEEKTAWNAKAEKPSAVPVKIQAGGWDSSTKKQTVPVSGVIPNTSKQVIWVTFASEAALDAYMDAGIVPVAQGANSVTFRADTIPTETIPVTVVMQEVSA